MTGKSCCGERKNITNSPCEESEIDPSIADGDYRVTNITLTNHKITAISGDYDGSINTLNIEGTNTLPAQDSVVILGDVGGNGAIGIGKDSIAGTACVSVGTAAESVFLSVAVGHSSYANTGGTSVGVSANAAATSVSVGQNSSNNFSDSVTVGEGSTCRGPNSILVGGKSTIYNDAGPKENNIIVGSEAVIGPPSGGVNPTDGNVVIGGQANSQSSGTGGTGNPNVVIGYQTKVSDGSGSVVIGAAQQTVGSCDYNTIVGFNNVNGAGGGAEYNNCVLLGKDSTATADGDIWLNNGLGSGGKFFVRRPAAGTTSDVLYYDSATHEVTYGAAGGGGGGAPKSGTVTLNGTTPISITGLGFTPGLIQFMQMWGAGTGFNPNGGGIGHGMSDGTNTYGYWKYSDTSGTDVWNGSTTHPMIDAVGTSPNLTAYVSSRYSGGFDITTDLYGGTSRTFMWTAFPA